MTASSDKSSTCELRVLKPWDPALLQGSMKYNKNKQLEDVIIILVESFNRLEAEI